MFCSVVGIYEEAIARKQAAAIKPMRGPWRITFDTNPDDCNCAASCAKSIRLTANYNRSVGQKVARQGGCHLS